MNIKDYDDLAEVVAKLKEINGWYVDNISLQYSSKGQVTVRLIKKKGEGEEENERTTE